MKSTDEIAAGDTVRLKIGGPDMVVINKVEEGFYCQYFDRLWRMRADYFLARNLTRVSGAEG